MADCLQYLENFDVRSGDSLDNGDAIPPDPVMVATHAKTARPQNQFAKKSRMIGNYKLLQKLSEGGMRSVYMAEQKIPVRRNVALKLVKAGMESKQIIARFDAERQALAMMNHPNIAKVLDAGETKSRTPYFVMELVEDVPITVYCDKKQLTVPQRLELFQQVCDALQHAHTKGIIHRDIKPSSKYTKKRISPSLALAHLGCERQLRANLHGAESFSGFSEQNVLRRAFRLP